VEGRSEVLDLLGPATASSRSKSARNGGTATAPATQRDAPVSTRKELSTRQILFPLLLTASILALVCALALQPPQPAQVAQATAEPPRDIYQISAVQLYRDYSADARATQARIGAKRILVTGTLLDLNRDYLGQDQVLLDVGNGATAADMTLNPDQYRLTVRLQRGQSIAVLCDQIQRYTDAPSGSGCSLALPALESGAMSLASENSRASSR
jgi:hypothetical protein